MTKITVDTNVLISATFWYGTSYKIIKLIEQQRLKLVLSLEIIKEYRDVLGYEEIQEKIKDKNLEMKRSVEKIISLANIVMPIRKIKAVEADSDDNKIIECALAGNTDYIITNDHHLLDLKEFEGINILTPEEFLKRIGSEDILNK